MSKDNTSDKAHRLLYPEEQSSQPNNNLITNNNNSDKQIRMESCVEYIYFNEKEIDQDLFCSICHLPLIDPIMHSVCENMFCNLCAKKVIGNKCPLCRGDNLNENCSSVPKYITNKLNGLKVQCAMCKGGVERGELKYHQEKYCPLHEAYQQVEEFKKKLDQEFQQRVQKLEAEHQALLRYVQEEKNQYLRESQERFTTEFKQREESLALQRNEFEHQVLRREKLEMSNKPIHLNVRGKLMTVSLGDFIHNEREPDNLFKKMFTGQHPCYQTSSKKFDDLIYFIDCDPIIFKHILDWLKYGTIDRELNVDLNKLVIVAKSFGIDFNKVILEHVKLSGMEIIGFYCSGMSLTNKNFSNTHFQNCNFSNTTFEKSKFENVTFENCKFVELFFKNCNFTNNNFIECDFDSVKFEEFLTFCNSTFNNCSFKNLDLRELKDLSKFKGSKFDSCLFNFNQFKNSHIQNIQFLNSDFQQQDLSTFILTNVTFTSVKLRSVEIPQDVKALTVKKSEGVLSTEEYRPFKLIKKITLTSGPEVKQPVHLFRFELPAGQSLGLQVGQHISLRITINNEEISRSYTPISSNDDKGFFDIAVKIYPKGVMTQHLKQLQVGESILVSGPKGRFIYEKNKYNKLGMIAGGTGITPMLPIIKEILKHNDDSTQVSLVYGNFTEQDIIFREVLEELAAKHNNFTLYNVLNEPPSYWTQGVGFISQEMIEKYLPAKGDKMMILLCGPPPMTGALKKVLEKLEMKRGDHFFTF